MVNGLFLIYIVLFYSELSPQSPFLRACLSFTLTTSLLSEKNINMFIAIYYHHYFPLSTHYVYILHHRLHKRKKCFYAIKCLMLSNYVDCFHYNLY